MLQLGTEFREVNMLYNKAGGYLMTKLTTAQKQQLITNKYVKIGIESNI
jgi:hypothetical protein